MKGVMHIAAWAGVTRDGESLTSKAGTVYGTVLLAIDSDKTDAQGRSELTFLRVRAFGELAKVAAELKKGGRAYLEGTLTAGIYWPEGGKPRLDLSVVAFKLEPMRIGRDRPRQEKPARIDYQAPLEMTAPRQAGRFDVERGDDLPEL